MLLLIGTCAGQFASQDLGFLWCEYVFFRQVVVN